VAGEGAEGKKLGTVLRNDGRRQVTYAGTPLYFYIHDNRPGQVLCQDVFEFGGLWLVVRSSGRPVR
jgi:predicted lipoprotein with Yx(FWY)xxD motif